MLLKSHPGAEINAVQDILGKDLPLAGGYTLGQIVRGREAGTAGSTQLLNQHMIVVAFGEA
jgi:hypothetical protein